MDSGTRYLSRFVECLRGVDRLITSEKDPGKLVEETCRLLTDSGGYAYSWIVLLDESKKILHAAESNIGDDFNDLVTILESGGMPPCMEKALRQSGCLVNRVNAPYCRTCKLKQTAHQEMESIIARLEYDGEAYGVVAAGFFRDQAADETQRNIFVEITGNIAYALHGIVVEWERDLSIHSLNVSERMLNAFLDHFPGPVFVRDEESRYVMVNEAFTRRFGPAGKWMGKTPLELFSREFAEEMLEEDRKTLEKGYHVYEKKLNGSGLVFEVHSFRMDMEDGEVLIGGIGLDLTEWYSTREALRESERSYRTVFQNTGSATVILDGENVITLSNRRFEELSGYPGEEICCVKGWFDFVDPGRRRMMKDFLEGKRKGSGTAECEFVFVDGEGSRKDVHLQAGSIPGTDMLVCSMVDISELKTTQKKLGESVRKLETLLKTMPDVMFVLDREGRSLECWFDEAPGRPGFAEAMARGGVAALNLPEEKIREILDTIGATLETGDVHTVEYRSDGPGERGFFEARMASLGRDRVICVVRDITVRRKAEIERLEMEARIQQTQKLESLGVLAGGIAHDFNNILMTIMGNADLAMMAVPENGEVREFLSEIMKAASAASGLAGQMLAYSGRDDLEMGPVDLNRIVNEMTHMLEISISKKVVLNLRLTPGIPAVNADSVQLRQILMNLITNASEAIGDDDGYISVTTGAVYCDGECLASTELADDLDEGVYVYLEVSDTGCGMDEKVRSQIFEPFFTTKSTGRGLGLSAVLGIIRSHGGALKVSSEPGKGTTFKILFPALEDEAGAPGGDEPADFPEWKGEGTVLFADDEESILALGRRMLERMGFRVLTAADGREAMELFRRNAREIDLLILDLTMPGMSGDEVLAQVRVSGGEDIPVIVSSGFSRGDVIRRFGGDEVRGFIRKPYRSADLARIVMDVMRSRGREASEHTEHFE